MGITKSIFRKVGKILAKKNLAIAGSLFYYNRPRRLDEDIIVDYIRHATLELVADEIDDKQLLGSTAELGVFTGEFASRINRVFPRSSLYLFDTFEGFDKRDTTTENLKNFSTANQDFANTSVELVMSKMKYPQKCIVRKGYFPDTAGDVNDQFIFVSLDADLYDPILAGLNFFYPKLVKGGYIFVHDYNNMEYKGARRAVKDFCDGNGISFVPLPDVCGTAIITK